MALSKSKSIHQYEEGRGLFVHICNMHFGGRLDGDETFQGDVRYRKGAEKDLSSIRCAAQFLDVEYLEYTDKTADEIRGIVEEAKRKMLKEKYVSFFLVISTHGEDDFVYGVDNQVVSIESEIINPFHNYNFAGLDGMPKNFFLNCCRGSEAPDSIKREQTAKDHAKFKTKKVEMIRKGAKIGDFMVVYSTHKGLASIRYQQDGSPMLETLASTIIDYAERKELATTDMETLVKKIKQKIHVKYGLSIEVSSSFAKEFFIPVKGIFKILNLLKLFISLNIRYY